MFLLKSILGVGALLFFFACSTAQHLNTIDKSSEKWTGTGLLFIYQLDTTDAETLEKGCSLILSDAHANEVEMHLPANQRSILVSAPAAYYGWKKLSCPHLARYELSPLAKYSFQAVRSRLNYIGGIVFHFPQSGDEMRVERMDSPSQAKLLSSVMSTYPKGWASALVDPYTTKAIPVEGLRDQNPAMSIHVTRMLKKEGVSVSTETLESALRTCDLEEFNRFPYRLGHLEMTAKYRGGEFKDLEQAGKYAFSDDFLNCLAQAFHTFRAASDSDLTVKLTI